MKLKKVCSVFLAVALVVGIASISSVSTSATTQITSIDFEGDTPYAFSHCLSNNYNAYPTFNSDTYFQTTYNKLPIFSTNSGPYGTGRASSGISEGWLENTRPTKVSFNINMCYLNTVTSNMDVASFDPLWRIDAKNYNYFRIGFFLTVNAADRTKDTLTLRSFNGNNAGALVVNGSISSNPLYISPVANLNTANDITVEFVYDWSKFTAENGYLVSLKVTLTDSNSITAVSTIPLKYRAPKTEVAADSAEIVSETKGYSMGFATANVNTAKLNIAFDDIDIWSYNTLTNATYGPATTIEPKASGYTMATASDTGNTNLRLVFDFSAAKQAATANGETITKFGALVVAGTKDAATMEAQLNNALGGNTASGYVFFGNDPADITGGTPDTYTVTILNSGNIENMGKRATALAYIVTDNGTYITKNNDTDKGIVSGVLNKSVMGLLKDVFKDMYLEEYDAEVTAGAAESETTLGAAVASYNTANSTSYSVSDIRTIATSTEISTNEQKLLLKALNSALCVAD